MTSCHRGEMSQGFLWTDQEILWSWRHMNLQWNRGWCDWILGMDSQEEIINLMYCIWQDVKLSTLGLTLLEVCKSVHVDMGLTFREYATSCIQSWACTFTFPCMINWVWLRLECRVEVVDIEFYRVTCTVITFYVLDSSLKRLCLVEWKLLRFSFIWVDT